MLEGVMAQAVRYAMHSRAARSLQFYIDIPDGAVMIVRNLALEVNLTNRCRAGQKQPHHQWDRS